MIARLFWEQLVQDDVTAVGGLTLGRTPSWPESLWHSHEAGKLLEGIFVRKVPRTRPARPGRGQPRRGTSGLRYRTDVITSARARWIARGGRSYKAEVVRVLPWWDR